MADDGGVETAEEATEPAEPDINELCKDMFEKMAVFLQGELTGERKMAQITSTSRQFPFCRHTQARGRLLLLSRREYVISGSPVHRKTHEQQRKSL